MPADISQKRKAFSFFLATALGLAGGAVCGSLILSFCYLIGRSGDTPPAPAWTISWAAVFLGVVYGAFFGAIAGALGYLLIIYQIGLRPTILPAFLGTILGGFCGALAGPPLAVLTGMIGFFVALVLLRLKKGEPKSP
jgi:hypothetical protein